MALGNRHPTIRAASQPGATRSPDVDPLPKSKSIVVSNLRAAVRQGDPSTLTLIDGQKIGQARQKT
jgi:hypothetical protein